MLCNVSNINFYWSPLTGFGDGKYRPVPRQGPRIWMYEVLSECVIVSVKDFPASVTGYGLLHVLVYSSSTWHIGALLLLVTGKKKGPRGIKVNTRDNMSNIECPVTFAPRCTIRGPILGWLRFSLQKIRNCRLSKRFFVIWQVRINQPAEWHSCCVQVLLVVFSKVKLVETFELWVFCHLWSG
jgi:hypothetical protein